MAVCMLIGLMPQLAMTVQAAEHEWKTLGSAGFSTSTAGSTSLCVDNGTPYVAFYDSAHDGKATVMYYEAPAAAPTLTEIDTLTGADEDAEYEITYDALAAAANEYDANNDPVSFRVESVTTGTLTKDDTDVEPGTTLLGDGESLVWTPEADANGVLDAFTVKAYDGVDASETAVQVKVSVAAVNDDPAGVPTVSGTAAVGETLSAVTDAVTDANGLGTFHYQWMSSATGSESWINIGTDSATYELTADDAGAYVRMAVSYTDGDGFDETVYSDVIPPDVEREWQTVGSAGFSADRMTQTSLYVYDWYPLCGL